MRLLMCSSLLVQIEFCGCLFAGVILSGAVVHAQRKPALSEVEEDLAQIVPAVDSPHDERLHTSARDASRAGVRNLVVREKNIRGKEPASRASAWLSLPNRQRALAAAAELLA
jgi:hypothetical protein